MTDPTCLIEEAIEILREQGRHVLADEVEQVTRERDDARRLLDDARARKPLNESIRIVLREALMDGDRYTPQVLVNLDRALSKMRPLYAAPVPPAASTKTHQWEDDHCIKCGDSDWYAGPICSECKVVQPAAVPEAVASLIPKGWVFYSADASIQSSNPRRPMTAMIKRDVDGVQWWLQLTEEEKERTSLYSTGAGMTLTLAIQNAVDAILSAADTEVKK